MAMKNLKRRAVAILAAALLVSGAVIVWAHGNARGEAKATVGKAQVTIVYGRPALRGRDMLSKISPGQIWRLGADIPTTLESSAALDFGGKRIAGGKHILLARLDSPGHWSLIVSSDTAQHYKPGSKLAEIPLEVRQAKDSVEELRITLSSRGGPGRIEIAWGTSRLTGSFLPAK
jgi:Protein of unknown function (DUF2911)